MNTHSNQERKRREGKGGDSRRRVKEGGQGEGHYLKQLAIILRPRLRIHRHRLMYRIRDLLRVPRIDDDGAVKRLSGAGELGEDHDAVAGLLAGYVFVGDLITRTTHRKRTNTISVTRDSEKGSRSKRKTNPPNSSHPSYSTPNKHH